MDRSRWCSKPSPELLADTAILLLDGPESRRRRVQSIQQHVHSLKSTSPDRKLSRRRRRQRVRERRRTVDDTAGSNVADGNAINHTQASTESRQHAKSSLQAIGAVDIDIEQSLDQDVPCMAKCSTVPLDASYRDPASREIAPRDVEGAVSGDVEL